MTTITKEEYKVYICHICALKLHYGYIDSGYYLDCFDPRCRFYEFGLSKAELKKRLIFDGPGVGRLPLKPYLKTTKDANWHTMEVNTALIPANKLEQITTEQRIAKKVLNELRNTTGTRAIIAGGAPRDWYFCNKDISDIDIFYETALDLSGFLSAIPRDLGLQFGPIQKISWNLNEDSYKKDLFFVQETILNKKYKFQFIELKKKELNLEKYIDAFDFGICKIAFDGRYYLHEEFLNDKAGSRLKTREEKVLYSSVSDTRIKKIQSYFPGWELQRTLYGAPVISAEAEDDDEEIPFLKKVYEKII